MQQHSKLESLSCDWLEPRLALAGLFSYTDIDGDLVTLRSSKGGNADLAAAVTLSAGTSGHLQNVNLAANPIFAGTSVTLSVKKAGGGDGQAAVGHIDATNVDLGKVSINGDLGRIVAGDTASATAGVVSLSVASLGRYGTTTGAPNLASTIRGDLKILAVKGDVQQARLTMIGGGIGKVTIGGSLVGGNADDSARIAGDTIGAVKIGVSIFGAGGNRSASIASGDTIASVTVGNSIIGGAGEKSGSLEAGNAIGSLKVGRDVVGGAGSASANINITLGGSGTNGVGDVTVGGSLLGGGGDMSGVISDIGVGLVPTVKIGGDVRGGSGMQSGSLLIGQAKTLSIRGSLIGGSKVWSGAVMCTGRIGSATVLGSVVGGTAQYTGIFTCTDPGSVGTVLIGGSVVGGKGEYSGSVFSATGSIDKLTVRGAVSGGDGDGSGLLGVGIYGGGAVLGSALVGGSVTGGAGVGSGSVLANEARSVRVGGSLFGGSGERSGAIQTYSQLNNIAIAKDVIGGTGLASGSMTAAGRITKASVGGSVIGGSGAGSATIGAKVRLGSLSVKGGMAGTSASQPLQVVGGGLFKVKAGETLLGIGTVHVGGSVLSTVFLAGWQPDSSTDGFSDPVSGYASIGKIVVKGDFSTSSIAAGVKPPTFPIFGTQLDSTIPGGTDCSIGSVVIGGTASGSSNASQHFGIVSRKIGSVKVKGVTMPIPMANAATPIGDTTNFVIRVISV